MANKYMGPIGLEELILLIKRSLSGKQPLVQFAVMPPVDDYIGKVVQYVGETDAEYRKGGFYYDDGVSWSGVNVPGTCFKVVTSLPDWNTASEETVYWLADLTENSITAHIKDPLNYNVFLKGGSSSGGFEIVDALPAWNLASAKLIYFIEQDNKLTGYVKDEDNVSDWFTVGSSETLTYKGSVLGNALPTADRTVGDVYNLSTLSIYGPAGTWVMWNGTTWLAMHPPIDQVVAEDSGNPVSSDAVFEAIQDVTLTAGEGIRIDDVGDGHIVSANLVEGTGISIIQELDKSLRIECTAESVSLKGSCLLAELGALSDVQKGDLWSIEDGFDVNVNGTIVAYGTGTAGKKSYEPGTNLVGLRTVVGPTTLDTLSWDNYGSSQVDLDMFYVKPSYRSLGPFSGTSSIDIRPNELTLVTLASVGAAHTVTFNLLDDAINKYSEYMIRISTTAGFTGLGQIVFNGATTVRPLNSPFKPTSLNTYELSIVNDILAYDTVYK